MKRKKGPKGLKLNEIVHQLFKYDEKLQWNWREKKSDIVDFLLNTLKLFEGKKLVLDPYLVFQEVHVMNASLKFHQKPSISIKLNPNKERGISKRYSDKHLHSIF